MIFDIEEIERRIGYEFKNDKLLLKQCFTHSSYAHDKKVEDNERLEFFGDAVLELVVTEYLLKTSGKDEGVLTKKRAEYVSKTPLKEAVFRLKLDEFLLFGKSYNKNNSSGEEKLFSSLYEALCAGIYLDGGLEAARLFILKTLIEPNEKAGKRKAEKKVKDFKSELQEYVQKNKLGKLSYEEISKKGPDHAPEFKVAVCLDGVKKESGKGSSKKDAERDAAEKLLNKLKTKKGKSGGKKR